MLEDAFAGKSDRRTARSYKSCADHVGADDRSHASVGTIVVAQLIGVPTNTSSPSAYSVNVLIRGNCAACT